jgi:GNAT superfamily N-acetyltransferase
MTGNTPVEFQSVTPDASEYEHLLETTGWLRNRPPSRLQLSAALTASWHIESAFSDGRLVAIGRVVSDGVLYALIVDVIVDPAWQRQGLGTAIVRRLVEVCERVSLPYIHLFAASGTRPFYERLGFVARPNDAPGMRWPPCTSVPPASG